MHRFSSKRKASFADASSSSLSISSEPVASDEPRCTLLPQHVVNVSHRPFDVSRFPLDTRFSLSSWSFVILFRFYGRDWTPSAEPIGMLFRLMLKHVNRPAAVLPPNMLLRVQWHDSPYDPTQKKKTNVFLRVYRPDPEHWGLECVGLRGSSVAQSLMWIEERGGDRPCMHIDDHTDILHLFPDREYTLVYPSTCWAEYEVGPLHADGSTPLCQWMRATTSPFGVPTPPRVWRIQRTYNREEKSVQHFVRMFGGTLDVDVQPKVFFLFVLSL